MSLVWRTLLKALEMGAIETLIKALEMGTIETLIKALDGYYRDTYRVGES